MDGEKYPVAITSDTRRINNFVKGAGKDGVSFDAMVFDTPSAYGIGEGRVSKLGIRVGNEWIVNYDRGWDIVPAPQHYRVYEAVMTKLNSLEPAHSLEDTLYEFDVTITETLKRTIRVVAENGDEAEQNIKGFWRDGMYVLDADDFTDVEFEAVPTGRAITRNVEPQEKGEDHDMNADNTGMSQGDATAPLAENQYVKELFSALHDSGRDSSGLSALLGHVSEMENFVKRAEDTISVMKSQLAEMKEVQNHPVKSALQNAIKALEQRVAEVRERLSKLKNNIVEGCKSAVQAFKEKGASALDKLASFFNIKGGLQEWKKSINATIRADDKAVAKIESFSKEYHSAGRAIKNMARVAIGKQPIDAKKEAGKLSKALAAPYKAQKAALIGLRKSIDKSIAGLDKLQSKTADRQAERTANKKPSILGQLEENLALVEQMKRETPILDRTKSKGAEL